MGFSIPKKVIDEMTRHDHTRRAAVNLKLLDDITSLMLLEG